MANTNGIPTGGYFFRDLPFLGLWGLKYAPFWHPVYDADAAVIDATIGQPLPTLSFFDTVTQNLLPNVSFVDPAFDTESNGTSADDHPLADIRLGERFISDVYYALGQRRVSRQHRAHRHVRRVGRLLRPRAAAAGHRQHRTRPT